MSPDVQYEQLEGTAQHTAAPGQTAADLRRLRDVPVQLAVEIGRATMTVGDTLELRPGSIVTLNRMAGEPVDLLVNGTQIARGEVVVIDEEFGLRLTEVVGDRARLAAGAGAAQAAEAQGGAAISDAEEVQTFAA